MTDAIARMRAAPACAEHRFSPPSKRAVGTALYWAIPDEEQEEAGFHGCDACMAIVRDAAMGGCTCPNFGCPLHTYRAPALPSEPSDAAVEAARAAFFAHECDRTSWFDVSRDMLRVAYAVEMRRK